jgi:hypothetical protein
VEEQENWQRRQIYKLNAEMANTFSPRLAPLPISESFCLNGGSMSEYIQQTAKNIERVTHY